MCPPFHRRRFHRRCIRGAPAGAKLAPPRTVQFFKTRDRASATSAEGRRNLPKIFVTGPAHGQGPEPDEKGRFLSRCNRSNTTRRRTGRRPTPAGNHLLRAYLKVFLTETRRRGATLVWSRPWSAAANGDSVGLGRGPCANSPARKRSPGRPVGHEQATLDHARRQSKLGLLRSDASQRIMEVICLPRWVVTGIKRNVPLWEVHGRRFHRDRYGESGWAAGTIFASRGEREIPPQGPRRTRRGSAEGGRGN